MEAILIVLATFLFICAIRVVLQNGAVGLEPLREAVAEYIQQETTSASRQTSGETAG